MLKGDVCCLWNCTVAGQPESHDDPCPQPKAPTMGMLASKLDHGGMEEGCLVWWTTFSFGPGERLGGCAAFTWGRDGSRIHYGKKTGQQRQCYAAYARGCYLDTYHLPKDCWRPCTPLHGSGLFQQNNNPARLEFRVCQCVDGVARHIFSACIFGRFQWPKFRCMPSCGWSCCITQLKF